MRTPTIGVGRGRRLPRLLLAFVVLFAAMVPLTARAEEGVDEVCYDDVVEQLWERQAYQKQERERHQEWRWLREHKDIKGWQHVNGAWVQGDPNTWYTVPASVIAAANFDPRSLLAPGETTASGSVNLSVYGFLGQPSPNVQYVFSIEGPSDYTTSETSPYGPGSIKVDQRLSDWSAWQNVGSPFYAESQPADSGAGNVQTRYVLSGSLEQAWSVDKPSGDGWKKVEGETRVVKVERDCKPTTWACIEGEVVEVNEGDPGYPAPYNSAEEAGNHTDCKEVCPYDPQLPADHEDCLQPVVVEVNGVCVVDGDAGTGRISIEVSVPGGATVEVKDGDNIVATVTESEEITLPEGKSYTWTATASTGFAISGASSGGFDVETCTRSISVEVEGVCEDNAPWLSWTVTRVNFDDVDEVTIIWNDIDPTNPLHSSVQALSGRMPWPGTEFDDEGNVNNWAGWVLTDGVWSPGADGFENTRPTTSITFSVNPTLTVEGVEYPGGEPECEGPPPDEVLASILVTVGSSCGDGVGEIDVTMSVAGGANVTVRRANGSVVGTLSDDGVLEVSDDATYTWSATPNEGFEFAPGAEQSGTLVVDDCSDDEVEAEELPFTGVDADLLAIVSMLLLGAGGVILATQREGRKES